MTMRRVRDNAPTLSQALHLQDIGLATPTSATISETIGTPGLNPTTIFLSSPGLAPAQQNFAARLQATSKVYRLSHAHDGDELHNLSYEEKIATLLRAKTSLEKESFAQKSLAERLQLELGKVQKQFAISMKEIEEVVNAKWHSIVSEKDAKLMELQKELKMEKYAAMLRKRESEGKSEGLVPGSRKFDMEVEKTAHDITKEQRQKVLLLQHRANTLMDEKKKLRAQSEQSDASAALKWKDAEHRIEEVELRMEEMKKLLATESMLRKKAERTVKFLRAQLVQAKKEHDALVLSKADMAESHKLASRPLSATGQSRTTRPSSGSSRRSSGSEAASSESEFSSKKPGFR